MSYFCTIGLMFSKSQPILGMYAALALNESLVALTIIDYGQGIVFLDLHSTERSGAY